MTPVIQAVFWMTGTLLSFTLMAVAVREISGEIHSFQIMLFRSLMGIVIVLAIAAYTGAIRQIRFRKLRLHLMRNICHFTGQNLWF